MRFGIKFIFGLSVSTIFLLTACTPENKEEAKGHLPPASQVEKPLPKFRNCRAILTAREVADYDTGVISIAFNIAENPNYDPGLGDVCKGDLANIWQDVEQYDELIEKHDQRVSHISFITPKLEYFPETYRELVLFIDDAAKADRDSIDTEQYNRMVLEDVLTLRRVYIQLILDETPNYFADTHAPIINKHLKAHNLQMGKYGAGEKVSFCIIAWDNCVAYLPPNKELKNTLGRDLDILYTGSWDWWKVEPLNK